MRLLQLIGISYDFFCKRKWMRLFLSILCGFSLFLSAYAMLQILYGYSAIGGYADAISGDKGQCSRMSVAVMKVPSVSTGLRK